MGYDLNVDVKSLRVLYRRLIRGGLFPEEASNLCAKLLGLEVVGQKPWTMKQLEALVFARYLAKNSTRP